MDLSHSAIRVHLSNALGDSGFVHDVNGDDKSGDVVYSQGGAIKKAPYKIKASAEGTPSAKIDHENAVSVTPRTVYDAKESSASGASRRSSGTADNGSMREFRDSRTQAAGQANDSSRNGGGEQRESGSTQAPQRVCETLHDSIRLVESAIPLEKIVLREAKADYEIKLIAPGKGASAFYPAEVLKRDGPTVFKSGTHVYLNHATAAEEAQRPEGDVKNLAGVLTTAAAYHESHAKGPGLYARMKVFADHGQMVEEKAAHVGMSIRANGDALMEGKKPALKEGVPILARLTSAESVDVVTRPGAGGMILTEAALAATQLHQEVSEMDAAEITKLQESVKAQAEVNRRLLERAIKADASEEATALLESVTLPDAAKKKIIETVLREGAPTKDGALDSVKLKELVEAETKREGAYLASITGSGRVVGMGVGQAAVAVVETLKPEEINARSVKTFMRLGLSESAAKIAVKGRAA